jgi:hypothetical protein
MIVVSTKQCIHSLSTTDRMKKTTIKSSDTPQARWTDPRGSPAQDLNTFPRRPFFWGGSNELSSISVAIVCRMIQGEFWE